MKLSGVLKKAVKGTFASTPGWRTFGPLLRPPGVIILTYHRILGPGREPKLGGLPVDVFGAQMRWLKKHCEPIEPEALTDRVRVRRRTRRPAVLVTFDDGYRDYYDFAYPILKELGIPAVVFVATSFMDTGGMLWTDEVKWALRTTKREQVKVPWSDEPVPLDGSTSRIALDAKVRGHLKKLPDPKRREAVTSLLGELDAPPLAERVMLSWDEIRKSMDVTRYGGHTHTHPILPNVDRRAASEEIRTCRDRIATETKRTPTLFAYPNGDFSAETQEVLREEGFAQAFTTKEGIASSNIDWLAVPRLPGADASIADFVWVAAGLMRT